MVPNLKDLEEMILPFFITENSVLPPPTSMDKNTVSGEIIVEILLFEIILASFVPSIISILILQFSNTFFTMYDLLVASLNADVA